MPTTPSRRALWLVTLPLLAAFVSACDRKTPLDPTVCAELAEEAARARANAQQWRQIAASLPPVPVRGFIPRRDLDAAAQALLLHADALDNAAVQRGCRR